MLPCGRSQRPDPKLKGCVVYCRMIARSRRHAGIPAILIVHSRFVAADGKTLRRSFDPAPAEAAIHMVSAWACDQNPFSDRKVDQIQ